MSKYLDSTGLSYLWSKIKALLTPVTSSLSLLSGRVTTIEDILVYENIYIGVGASKNDVMIDANHYNKLYKGNQVQFSYSNATYLWVIVPQSYTPNVLMSGISVPMAIDSTVTVGDVTFNAWKSASQLSGTYSIYLL